MATDGYTCAHCGAELDPPPYFRRDTCPACLGDLHACIQCIFHDPALNNECSEPQAERVVDKTRANFCDYFKPATGKGGDGLDKKAEALKALDDLFKK